MVYPIGYGDGFTGHSGTGFRLLAIIFTEFFGVMPAQLIGALAPSIQACSLGLHVLRGLLIKKPVWVFFSLGRNVVQFCDCHSVVRDLRRYHSAPRHSGLATSVALRVEPLG